MEFDACLAIRAPQFWHSPLLYVIAGIELPLEKLKQIFESVRISDRGGREPALDAPAPSFAFSVPF